MSKKPTEYGVWADRRWKHFDTEWEARTFYAERQGEKELWVTRGGELIVRLEPKKARALAKKAKGKS